MKQVSYKAFSTNNKNNLIIVDQRLIPFEFKTMEIATVKEIVFAIKSMAVRGAGVIGNLGAFGVAFAYREAHKKPVELQQLIEDVRTSRPTAVNLMWAVDRMKNKIAHGADFEKLWDEAIQICEEDKQTCEIIGESGFQIFQELLKNKNKKTLNILTHCNAGLMGIVDKGTALAPIYTAFENGMDVHVWVDETRPRNQGAFITAWELKEKGIPHTLIADNTGGLLMQKNKVDAVIVGADRVTRNGDVANKIGTYLKALAAYDNQVPFYVALPCSTIDFNMPSGQLIPIEERTPEEITHITGLTDQNILQKIRICPENTHALNLGFDITPAKFVTGYLTEKGHFKKIDDLLNI